MAPDRAADGHPSFSELVTAGAPLVVPSVGVAEVAEMARLGGQAIEMAEDPAVTPERRQAAREIAYAACGQLARLARIGLEATGRSMG